MDVSVGAGCEVCKVVQLLQGIGFDFETINYLLQ